MAIKKAPTTVSEEAIPWYKRSTVIVALIGAMVALTGTFVKVVLPRLSGESRADTLFRGRVSDNQGRSISGAKIVLEGNGLPPLIYTDSEGLFAFNLSSDEKGVKIRVEASGYDVYARRVDVTAKTEPEDIRLTPAKADRKVGLSGVVLDHNEKGIQGAKVYLDGVAGVSSVETSSKGVFNFEDLPLKIGDRVRLVVVLEGYRPNPYLEDIVIGDYSPTPHLTKSK